MGRTLAQSTMGSAFLSFGSWLPQVGDKRPDVDWMNDLAALIAQGPMCSNSNHGMRLSSGPTYGRGMDV